MAITFLAFCYWGFARTKSAWKAKGNRSVHPLGQIDSSKTSKRTPRPLCCLLFAALWLTAAAYGQSTPQSTQQLEQQVQQLQQLVQQLQLRVEALEKKNGTAAPATPVTAPAANQATATVPAPSSAAPAAAVAANNAASAPAPPPASTASVSNPQTSALPSFLDGTTLDFTLDGYYEYNFNRPIGQMNQLRAYDLSSNSFSLNQADIVVDHPTDVAHGKRIGGRLDIMFGQATETLQGNTNNELHPDVWRNVFQAYGTYVAPVGSGLTIDFGKWASALGVEGNYTKDQINYSRSYYFNFLPFYHMGFRTAYTFDPKLTVAYWLVNGAQQTDAFSGFKSQNFAFTLHPASTVSWQINYFFGQQQRSFVLSGNPDSTQTATPIVPTPNGKEHIFDTYATWNATPKWTLVGESDYIIHRDTSESAPQHVAGGAAYIDYQWTPKFAMATRAEYLADPQGLFSGTSQALKESTVTADYLLTDGFKVFLEWRRDFSNQPYFHTATEGLLVPQQTTATMGLVWWFGQMQGAW
ncbi:MAG: outer membrane beta-barrel protein [Acidobacteriaceae bacterium]